jgi:hypothetical protein
MGSTNPIKLKVRDRAKKLQTDEGVSPLISPLFGYLPPRLEIIQSK